MSIDKVSEITECFMAIADEKQAKNLSRFFKTAPGEYGFGDKFLGIRVPQTRAIVKAIAKDISEDEANGLIRSEWHEVRLAGFLSLAELYRRACRQKDEARQKAITDIYLNSIPFGNNWDLVDIICPNILGHRMLMHPEERHILYDLAESAGLWENRVSIVSTLAMIRKGQFEDTINLAIIHIKHPHDLMHKATGWMLREIGKRDEETLLHFLDRYATSLHRTALRYSLEKLSPQLRQHYMKL